MKSPRRLSRQRIRHLIRLSIISAFIIAFSLAGYMLLRASSAATYAVNKEAETATLAGKAGTVGSTGASGSSAVQFGGTQNHTFSMGVVGWYDDLTMARIQKVNGKLVRTEFTASASQKSLLESSIVAAAAHGITVQPLIGWDNGTPAPDLTFLADWAKTYGPGGTFWAGKAVQYPITNFELGNENSYYYKSGLPTDSRFQSLAFTYGQRAVAAARSINAANPQCGVLVELDVDTGTEDPAWKNKTLDGGGADLIRLMHGPVMHLYGPRYQTRLDNRIANIRARGLNLPYYVTEWGFSSDNGRNLSNNFGYPTNMTSDQVAAESQKVTTALANEPTKIRELMAYQHSDQRDPGTATDREYYFGLLHHDGSNKGSITTEAQREMAAYPYP